MIVDMVGLLPLVTSVTGDTDVFAWFIRYIDDDGFSCLSDMLYLTSVILLSRLLFMHYTPHCLCCTLISYIIIEVLITQVQLGSGMVFFPIC